MNNLPTKIPRQKFPDKTPDKTPDILLTKLPTKIAWNDSYFYVTGKTLQVIGLIHTLFTYKLQTNVQKVLIICPKTTILNWVNQFNRWLAKTEGETQIDVIEISAYVLLSKYTKNHV